MGEDIKEKCFFSKEQILELYTAGRDSVISFIEHIQDLINGLEDKFDTQQKIIEQQEERIIKTYSRSSGKPPSNDRSKLSRK